MQQNIIYVLHNINVNKIEPHHLLSQILILLVKDLKHYCLFVTMIRAGLFSVTFLLHVILIRAKGTNKIVEEKFKNKYFLQLLQVFQKSENRFCLSPTPGLKNQMDLRERQKWQFLREILEISFLSFSIFMVVVRFLKKSQ